MMNKEKSYTDEARWVERQTKTDLGDRVSEDRVQFHRLARERFPQEFGGPGDDVGGFESDMSFEVNFVSQLQ